MYGRKRGGRALNYRCFGHGNMRRGCRARLGYRGSRLSQPRANPEPTHLFSTTAAEKIGQAQVQACGDEHSSEFRGLQNAMAS